MAKKFINYSIRDIAGAYDWEFLRGSCTASVSADGVYDLNRFTQLEASSVIRAICSAAGDNGADILIAGKYISNPTVASASDVEITYSTIDASAAASTSATQGYTHIDYITKPVTIASVFVTSASGLLVTLGGSETYVANDIRKINSITDGTYVVWNFDWNNQVKANPNSASSGSVAGYDIDYRNKLRAFNVGSTRSLTVYYQRLPKYLIHDQDRTEFPYEFYPDIVQYAYYQYALRYQDEQDAWNGKQAAPFLLDNIIKKWTLGKDKKNIRVMPSWFRRRI